MTDEKKNQIVIITYKMKRLFRKKRWLGTILDIIGMTVAFTVFMVIMIQVLYDWR